MVANATDGSAFFCEVSQMLLIPTLDFTITVIQLLMSLSWTQTISLVSELQLAH